MRELCGTRIEEASIGVSNFFQHIIETNIDLRSVHDVAGEVLDSVMILNQFSSKQLSRRIEQLANQAKQIVNGNLNSYYQQIETRNSNRYKKALTMIGGCMLLQLLMF